MKKLLTLCLVLSLVVGMAACSKKEAAKPKPVTPAPVTKPSTAPAPTPAPVTKPAADPAPAPATAPKPGEAGLVGSKWTLGDMTVAFTDASKVNITGGPLAGLANGLDATYTLKDGVVEVNAMGKPRTGTFDGKTLVIDGKTAVRAQ